MLPIRPCPQSAAATGRERPMDLRVAAAKSPICIDVPMLHRSSSMPLTASSALDPYEVRSYVLAV